MKTKIGLFVLIVFVCFPLFGQKSIIDSFKLVPNHPLTTDDIKFLVFYNNVPGLMEPEASIHYHNDSILIRSTINSASGNPGSGCCLGSYIDTIEIGTLSQGEYTLIHILFDIGKVGFMGTDTIFSFTVSELIFSQLYNRDKISAYPNPTKGELTIILNRTNTMGLTVMIYNMFSQEIKTFRHVISNNKIIIDLKENPNGLYFVKISDKKIYYYIKVIKE